jgi:hypothetical protein
MIEHVWSVLCSKSITDRETNNICLLDVLEQFSLGTEVPVDEEIMLPVTFELVTLWSRGPDDEPGRGRARITFQSPGGDVLNSREYDLELTDFRRSRSRTRIEGLLVRGPGRYVFIIDLKGEGDAEWRQAGSVPLYVVSRVPTEKKEEEKKEEGGTG